MGIIHLGPPEELIFRLKETYRIQFFVETGTYLGKTAYWASHHFEEVWTIEAGERLFENTRLKYGNVTNIHFVLGDSRKALKDVCEALKAPALFWLDSHWSGDQTYGVEDECPLIHEIRTIIRSPVSHFVMIDDSRMFLSPPPEPHKMEQWPSIAQVIQAFDSENSKYYLVIIEDVIVAVPEFAKTLVAGYCREKNTLAWKQYIKSLSEPK